jgi:hypothetical protein
MKSLLKLANEFEATTEYIKNISPTISSLQKKFPNVALKSFEEFKTFLYEYLTTLVRKYLVSTRSVKNCSGISPDFAEFAAKHGFAVVSESVPGHMRNIFLGKEGPYMVDLSFIQFTCGYTGYDDRVLVKTLKEIYHSPEKAIKIQKLPLTYFGNFREPHGEYDNLYNPVKHIENYHSDNERQEEDLQNLHKWEEHLNKEE